jgi:trehalose synthase
MKRSPQLDQYRPLVGEDLLARIYRAAWPLSGVHVLHLNTTAEGGGVAELLHSLLPMTFNSLPWQRFFPGFDRHCGCAI